MVISSFFFWFCKTNNNNAAKNRTLSFSSGDLNVALLPIVQQANTHAHTRPIRVISGIGERNEKAAVAAL